MRVFQKKRPVTMPSRKVTAMKSTNIVDSIPKKRTVILLFLGLPIKDASTRISAGERIIAMMM